MPPNNIIRSHNDPNRAVTLKGKEVQREKQVFLRSYQQQFPVLQTSMHFCFYDPTVMGTTLFCTCGSSGIIVGYHAYKQFSSYVGNEVIACHHLIHYGQHADGSHE
jgi:hypothetical protein